MVYGPWTKNISNSKLSTLEKVLRSHCDDGSYWCLQQQYEHR